MVRNNIMPKSHQLLSPMLRRPDALREAPLAELMLVDDRAALLSVFEKLLRSGGYDVRSATSGRAALQAIQTSRPDLVITDIDMPQMSGPELLEAVLADPLTADVPFIFISSFDRDLVLRRSPVVEEHIYLRKPFEFELLNEAIVALLEERNKQTQ